MADQGFDRTQRHTAHGGARFNQCAGDGFSLGPIPHCSAGPMRFDQSQRGRREPGLAVGPVQGPLLPLGQRRGHTQCTPIGRAGRRLDHGIDTITVTLGISQSLHDGDANPFGNHDAVGIAIEGARLALRRQGLRFGETQISERALNGIHTAGDGNIGTARLQFLGSQGDRGQRRTAGGIHGEVHTTKIKPIGDPPCGHIEQHASEGFVGPFRQSIPHFIFWIFDKARQFGAQAQLHAEIADTTAGAENDRGVLAIEIGLPRAHTGITQCSRGALQRQQLHRIDGLHRTRRNAECGRIKYHLVEETAPTRVDLVARILVRVEVQLFIPAILGHLGDGGFQIQHLAPEIIRAINLRQDHADTDDRDIAGTRRFGWRDLFRRQLAEQSAGAIRDIAVQLFNPQHLVVQCRNLPDHVHATQLLSGVIKLDDASFGITITAFGCNPQTAHVEIFQLIPDVIG